MTTTIIYLHTVKFITLHYHDHHHHKPGSPSYLHTAKFTVTPTLWWPPPYTRMTILPIHCQVHHRITTTPVQGHVHRHTYTIMITTTYRDYHHTYTPSGSASYLYYNDHHHNIQQCLPYLYTVIFTVTPTLWWPTPYTKMTTIPLSSSSSHYTIMITPYTKMTTSPYLYTVKLITLHYHDHHNHIPGSPSYLYKVKFTVTPTPWCPPPYTRMTTLPIHCQGHHRITTTPIQGQVHRHTYTILIITLYQDHHNTYTRPCSSSHLHYDDQYHIPGWPSYLYTVMFIITQHNDDHIIYQDDHNTYTLSHHHHVPGSPPYHC